VRKNPQQQQQQQQQQHQKRSVRQAQMPPPIYHHISEDEEATETCTEDQASNFEEYSQAGEENNFEVDEMGNMGHYDENVGIAEDMENGEDVVDTEQNDIDFDQMSQHQDYDNVDESQEQDPQELEDLKNSEYLKKLKCTPIQRLNGPKNRSFYLDESMLAVMGLHDVRSKAGQNYKIYGLKLMRECTKTVKGKQISTVAFSTVLNPEVLRSLGNFCIKNHYYSIPLPK